MLPTYTKQRRTPDDETPPRLSTHGMSSMTQPVNRSTPIIHSDVAVRCQGKGVESGEYGVLRLSCNHRTVS